MYHQHVDMIQMNAMNLFLGRWVTFFGKDGFIVGQQVFTFFFSIEYI